VERDLSINKFKLDMECVSHASMYFRYAEAAQQAKARVGEFEDKLKLVIAKRNIDIRNDFINQGTKFTESVIDASLTMDEDVKAAREQLRNAQAEAATMSVAVSAFDHRKSQLDNLTRLYCSKNKPGELQVFEVSHFLFEKELIDEARGDDGDEGFTEFADPDTGREIRFRIQKISRGGFEFNEYRSFSFSERDEPLDEALLESAISFDEVMLIPTYEEAQSILFGVDDDDGGDSDDDLDEDEKPRKGKPSRKPADDDDERSAKKPEKGDGKKPAGKCPYGHKLGADCDQHDDCDDCDQWDKCVNASGK